MSKSKISADTVGASAGIGTLVILLADRIQPADSVLRQLLVLGAPTLTIVSGWLWALAKNQVFVLLDDFNSRRTLRAAENVLEAARKRGADKDQIAALTASLNEIEREKMRALIGRSTVDFEKRA